jgi:Rieske Fe-S protein
MGVRDGAEEKARRLVTNDRHLGVGESPIGRRTALRIGIGGLGIGLVLTARPGSAQEGQASLPPTEGDLLVKVSDPSLEPLTPADIGAGAAQILAWPMDPIYKVPRSGSRLNQLLLVRPHSDNFGPATKSIAADGVVAYSAICTHNGCEVTDWSPDEEMLSCPCHSARYDPKHEARVVDGPAPRPLPALPLKVEAGKLVVAGSLSARAGFQSA